MTLSLDQITDQIRARAKLIAVESQIYWEALEYHQSGKLRELLDVGSYDIRDLCFEIANDHREILEQHGDSYKNGRAEFLGPIADGPYDWEIVPALCDIALARFRLSNSDSLEEFQSVHKSLLESFVIMGETLRDHPEKVNNLRDRWKFELQK